MRKAVLALSSIALLVLACGGGDAPVELGAANGIGKGEQLYRMNCVLCHGADGRLGFNGAKDLTASALTKEEMIVRVREGKGTMMPYKDVLNAKEIEAVVAHVRSLAKAE